MHAMIRAAGGRAQRAALAAGLLAALGMSAGAAGARAATFATGCAGLQATIDTVAAHPGGGQGDSIVLSGLCTAATIGTAGVSIPEGSSFTLEGQAGSDAGFDGSGINAPLLATAPATHAGALALNNLTFEHAQLAGMSALFLRAWRVTLSGDRILENHLTGEGAHAADVEVGSAGCSPAAGSPAVTVSGSTFASNSLSTPTGAGSGAALLLRDPCEDSRNSIEGNTFQGNSLQVAGTAEALQGTGAGLSFLGAPGHTAPVSQSGNVFDSNTISALAPAGGNYGGAGEWLEYASLLSVGDRFSRNLVPGTTSSSPDRWSWGGGLGVDDIPSCPAGHTETTLENDVLSGNAIGPGTSGDLGGGGVWVGCVHLHVLDSTVTLNSAPNGSGVEGEPGDQLAVVNSILAMDSGGYEVTGFDEPGLDEPGLHEHER